MSSTNIDMLQTVAKGLGELNKVVVFVGGAVAELYVTDPAASEIRPTLDVDCVIELSSRKMHQNWKKSYGQKVLRTIFPKMPPSAGGFTRI